MINNYPTQNTLIETTLSLKLSAFPEDMWKSLIHYVYNTFIPKMKYLERLNRLHTFSSGISIRRGGFLWYFPEARQEISDIKTWLDEVGDYIVFSDDPEARLELSMPGQNNDIDRTDLALLEFLCLARKCRKIYDMEEFFLNCIKFKIVNFIHRVSI